KCLAESGGVEPSRRCRSLRRGINPVRRRDAGRNPGRRLWWQRPAIKTQAFREGSARHTLLGHYLELGPLDHEADIVASAPSAVEIMLAHPESPSTSYQ